MTKRTTKQTSEAEVVNCLQLVNISKSASAWGLFGALWHLGRKIIENARFMRDMVRHGALCCRHFSVPIITPSHEAIYEQYFKFS